MSWLKELEEERRRAFWEMLERARNPLWEDRPAGPIVRIFAGTFVIGFVIFWIVITVIHVNKVAP